MEREASKIKLKHWKCRHKDWSRQLRMGQNSWKQDWQKGRKCWKLSLDIQNIWGTKLASQNKRSRMGFVKTKYAKYCTERCTVSYNPPNMKTRIIISNSTTYRATHLLWPIVVPVKLTTFLHVVPRLRMCGAIPSHISLPEVHKDNSSLCHLYNFSSWVLFLFCTWVAECGHAITVMASAM